MQKYVTDSSIFLPSYDKKKAQGKNIYNNSNNLKWIAWAIIESIKKILNSQTSK